MSRLKGEKKGPALLSRNFSVYEFSLHSVGRFEGNSVLRVMLLE